MRVHPGEYKGMSTLLTHYTELENAERAHIAPIYQNSVFIFEDTASGAAVATGEVDDYYYTRWNNPNHQQLARKLAALEALDILRQNHETDPDKLVGGFVFASGMAAVTAAILSCVHTGETVLTQSALYDGTYLFLKNLAPQYGINVVWVSDNTPEGWKAAFKAHPEAKLAYIETPVNPALRLTDIKSVNSLAHQHGARVVVDNTFATPYCQRPFNMGVDIIIHSTTKYLSGHGQVIGGALLTTDLALLHGKIYEVYKILGATPSPFDTWLANIGLKTFELRMERHCENALQIAKALESHPEVDRVFYPGLPSHPDYDLAKKQMLAYGGMIAFDLKGGIEAGQQMMDRVRVATLAVSLGNVDTLVQHPASMTHRHTPRELRLEAGITDGLVRLSVGIEDPQDLVRDLVGAIEGN
ncbi:MAG: aminotransferase class I/II-fold pyridoxal phosphate-dependent enzyme [Chloroflexota bacterium]|nr:aminotransferase class I/II-fold pyridoxal phosphate-dependent enzyme [Chloroflexota bacterium]